MAAAGGGLPASAVGATVNTTATVRCRFPGRPWAPRSLLRTEKRSHVGRVRAEDRKGPRPIDVGATVREDPSLSRLLGLAEKHRQQREAGFCTSESDEERDFTGFKVDGQCSLRSGKRSSLKLASSRVKRSSAPDLKSSQLGKPGMRGRRFSRTGKKPGRPKMVIKMATRRVTKRETEQTVGGVGHLKQGSSSRRNGRVLRNQRENDENVVDGSIKDEDTNGRSQKRGSSAADNRRQEKLVWTLTVVKGKERASKVKDTQGQRASTEHAKTHRIKTKEVSGSDQVSSESVTKQKRGRKSAADKELLQSPGTDVGASLSDSLSSSQKKPFVRQRKQNQEELHHNIPDSEQKVSSMPKKRQRLSSADTESTNVLQPVEEQKQPLESGGQSEELKHSSKPVVSARSSRIIKIPKRFMDDERMSALPERASLKKPALAEIPTDLGKPNIDLQTVESGSKQKAAQEPVILSNDEKSVLEKVQSQGVKPASRLSGGARGRGGRIGQTMDHYKIYWKLKKLTACLAKRKMQRIAGDSSRLTVEDTEEDAEKRKSDLKLQDMHSSGVVPKVAIHVGDHSDQTPLASLTEASSKENVETATHEDTTERSAQNSQLMVEQGGLPHRMSVSGANKRMIHLLKRARVQLIKIDQQKQLKSAQLLSGSVRAQDGPAAVMRRGRKKGKRAVPANPEAAPQEQLIGGPRIKHVCRAAAVALGQPRALVPDDIPRLSALPLHEREGITASPAEEGTHLSFPHSVRVHFK